MGLRPTYEGYSLTDHRASPGFTTEQAQQLGLDPAFVKEGKVLEMATLSCRHCRTVQHKNPLRQRPRGQCPKCNFGYICDICDFKMTLPDYVHISWDKRVDMVMGGEPDPFRPLLTCT
jgi:hypothetical protein